KKVLGYDPDKSFEVDEEALAHAREVAQRGLDAHAQWDEKFEAWRNANPDKAALYDRIREGKLPEEFDKAIDELVDKFETGSKVATRKASGAVINAIAAVMPELWGGSADLGGSNNTNIKGAASFIPAKDATVQWPDANEYGRQLHFGVREFAMGAITNGILLGSDTRPFNGTFFQFSDYERPAVRLAALMEIPNLYIWTHDSVALGEDGPTHQPIEHLAAVRGIPQLEVVRPADEYETAEAYRYFFEKDNTFPTALILTRQGVPTLEETKAKARDGVRRGAYVLVDTDGEPDVLIMGTGSEVQHAVAAAKSLADEGVKARVISVPSMEWFEEQPEEYREEILPADVKARVSVEAGIAMPWYKYLGTYGKPVSIESFGLQGDGDENMRDLGITAEHVEDAAKASIAAVQAAK
ncbi:transketolase-like TK C-terminal-containing protein, partial [Bifidobacterium sp.]